MPKTHRLLATFLLVLTLMFSQWQFDFVPNVKSNPSWLSGWDYRKSHVINSATGAGTNYQVKITCHYGSGSDSGGAVYLSSHSRTDFGDVRFTDNDETTPLDYWMESKTDSNNAVFWVEVADDLSSSAVTIYVYYGKSDASTTSNGATTFIFWDDFEDTDFSEYTVYNSVSRSNTHVKHGSYAAKTLNGLDYLKQDGSMGLVNIALGLWIYDGGGSDSGSVLLVYDGSSQGVALQDFYSSTHYVKRVDGTFSATSIAQSTGWHKLEVRMVANVVKGIIDGNLITLGTDFAHLDQVFIGNPYSDQADSGWFDAFYRRKYVDPEPSHGSWGSEETEGAAESNSVELKTPNNAATETSWSVDFVFNATFYQTIQNASLHIENTTVVPTAISWSTNHWNTSAVDNKTDETIAYSFSGNGEGSYKWNVEVFNSTHGVYASSNRTLTVDVPPRYQNVDSNSTSIAPNGTILLYAQGYDGVGLDYAVLATNETGSWCNYSKSNLVSSFTQDSQMSFAGTYAQGVACNGTFVWTTTNNLLCRYDMAGNQLATNTAPHTDGTDMTQVNSILYLDGNLYVGSNNAYNTPRQGYIKVFSASTLVYIEEHYVGAYYCEGCSYHDEYFWTVGDHYDNSTGEPSKTQQYNTSWNLIATHNLTYASTGVYGGSAGYQGNTWIGDYYYCNIHGTATFPSPVTCDVYYWNGTGFEEAARLTTPNDYCHQGVYYEPTSDYMWWAERHSSTSRYATNSSITYGSGYDYHGSPIDLNNVADTWAWGNFTWCNTTITSGTTIQWRIYYNDTYGNWNGTSIQSFQVGTWEITINTATHSWTITAGQTDILINESTISITVSALANFDIQVKGSGALTNGSNTIALSNVKVNYTGAAISLTTSYQNVPGLTDQTLGTDIDLTFQLWLTCPSPQPVGDYTYTLTVKVKEHS